jgi:hypothetical protein
VGFFPYKKDQMPSPPSRFSVPCFLALAAILPAGRAGGQAIFGWPIRTTPQPEAVLIGAGAVFWNPAGLAGAAGGPQELWVTHVDGPDATGVGGMAAAGVMDLPLDLRGALGYWHLGIQDIARTTDSPEKELGEVQVAEDVALLAVARDLGTSTGIGVGLRFSRGSVDGNARSDAEGEVGIFHRSSLPLAPSFGLTIQGLGTDVKTLAGVEVSVPPLASTRIPLSLGYGVLTDWGPEPAQHRFSFRGSWKELFHLGMGVSHLGENNGWAPLWMLGANFGRYSFAVLRESLANDFGAIHFFRAAIRFPQVETPVR